MFKAIVQWIVNNTAAWATPLIKGANLQVGWRPDSAPDRCILVAETGPAPGIFELPDRVDKHIMIKSRALKYFDAQDDAMAIWTLLNGTAGWELPEVVAGEKFNAAVVESISAPQYLGIDKKERHEFSTNFIFKIEARD